MITLADILVVNSYRDVEVLGQLLEAHSPDYVGWDTETTGCNPRKESPVKKAVAFLQSFAWRAPDGTLQTAVFLPDFADFTISSVHTLVGHNLWHFDCHVNPRIRNPVRDTLVMSRLLNPGRDFEHGLKAWGKRLGYDVTQYTELVRRPRHSDKVESYARSHEKTKQYCKKCNTAWQQWDECPNCGARHTYACPVTITAEAEWQRVNFESYEELDLKQVWDEYLQRRQKIIEYAAQDAVLHLELYEHLKAELEKVKW